MKVRRIHITGASGSGTSTLGEALARQLGWGWVDADDHYWLPTTPRFQQKRNWIERNQSYAAAVRATAETVASGSIIGWGPDAEDAFDLIVYLGLPTSIRLERLRRRELARHGAVNEEFIAWAAAFDEGDVTIRSRRRLDQWLGERTARVFRLEGDLTVEARVAAVLAQI
jgi:adenylate kinase family enzyme